MQRWRLNRRHYDAEHVYPIPAGDDRVWAVTDDHFLVFFRDYRAAVDYTIYQNSKEE